MQFAPLEQALGVLSVAKLMKTVDIFRVVHNYNAAPQHFEEFDSDRFDKVTLFDIDTKSLISFRLSILGFCILSREG